MTRLAGLVAFVCALWIPALLGAQSGASAQDDRGYLQALLEDNLSDVGREVRIIGFTGALSARAGIQELTIADRDGIWLTLRGVVLDWNRAALLGGRLDITELSADEILITRRPNPDPVPTPEASGFALPELPVTVDIAAISAKRVELGLPVLGEAAVIRLEGSAQLADGNGQAKLDIQRIDGPRGALQFDGAYGNLTTELALSLTLSEGKDGIVANMLGLPGRPDVDLGIAGQGPLGDFSADITLSTDGEKRLTGNVTLVDQDISEESQQAVQKSFSAELAGDIAPVFLPAYRGFFGTDIRLAVKGKRQADGALSIDMLDLKTQAMDLGGALLINPQGWPDRFSLTGRIADPTGAPVLLPLNGPKTYVTSADLALGFDAEAGDEWKADVGLTGLRQDGFALASAQLVGLGTMIQGDLASLGRVQGDIDLTANGIAAGTPALTRAIGTGLGAALAFDWAEKSPLRLSELTITGDDYTLSGAATLQDFSNGITVSSVGDVTLIAPDISQFSQLAGLPLKGAVNLGFDGNINLLGGAFVARIGGAGTDLGIGQPRFDPLIAGDSTLLIHTRRDETGTILERLQIATESALVKADAQIRTGASKGQFDIRVDDASLVDPGLSGPATLTGSVQQTGPDWALDLHATGPGNTSVSADGIVQIIDRTIGPVHGKLSASADTLAPYANLTGQRLSGAVELSLVGRFDPRDGAFDAEIEALGRDIALGQAMLDPLTRGTSKLSTHLHRDENAVVTLDRLNLSTPEVSAQATGAAHDGKNTLNFSARLRDLGLFTDSLSGPANARGTAILSGDTWQVDVDGDGVGGITSKVTGSIRSDGGQANLRINGVAPMGLLNRSIQPNSISGLARYDLALNGTLALSSLSGSVTAQAGRIVLPAQRLAFELTKASAQLDSGRAQLDISARVASGGNVQISGPVSLSAPYTADLQARLNNIALSDAAQYDTSVGGVAALRGPLAGGARISADLSLGATEIRLAQASVSTVPLLKGLEHVNEPADVRQSRARAGLLGDGTGTGSGAGRRAYPIDIRLRAPSRIFVRGRGLDAELGGALHLTGTSANVVPQGQFDMIRGRLDILGKRLTLTEGSVRMRGGFDPYLRFVAQSRAEDTDIRIIVEGHASAPQVSFTSSPELPEDEVLSLLLFGRDITQISPLQALRLAAAIQTLAGGGTDLVARLRSEFALDDLDISTDADGTTNATIGKYVTDNIYTDLTVGSDGTSEVNLNLTLSPSVTARGSLGSDGDTSLGVFFERDY